MPVSFPVLATYPRDFAVSSLSDVGDRAFRRCAFTPPVAAPALDLSSGRDSAGVVVAGGDVRERIAGNLRRRPVLVPAGGRPATGSAVGFERAGVVDADVDVAVAAAGREVVDAGAVVIAPAVESPVHRDAAHRPRVRVDALERLVRGVDPIPVLVRVSPAHDRAVVSESAREFARGGDLDEAVCRGGLANAAVPVGSQQCTWPKMSTAQT
jgi:hypothetical protein